MLPVLEALGESYTYGQLIGLLVAILIFNIFAATVLVFVIRRAKKRPNRKMRQCYSEIERAMIKHQITKNIVEYKKILAQQEVIKGNYTEEEYAETFC
jgi:hypothetical protein